MSPLKTSRTSPATKNFDDSLEAYFRDKASAFRRVLTKIAAKEKAIENGSFYEFTGPLYDQSGKLRVAKGTKMQVLKGGTNSLYGMNWLVKGVIGSPKG